MEHPHTTAAGAARPASSECCQGQGQSCCGGEKKQAPGECCGGHEHHEDRATVVSAFDVPRVQLADVRSLDTLGLIARYRRGIESFDRRIFFLDDQQLDIAFLSDSGVGRWPIRVLVGHLADAEIATVHRVRRAVAEDQPVIAPWDENAFIDAGVYGHASAAVGEGQTGRVGPSNAFPLAGFVAVIHTLRRWMSEWLMTLSADQWKRVAMHPQRGELSVRTLVEYDTWHLEHHAWYLNAKVEKMLGVDMAAALDEPAGGCGSGCGCHK
ncbi:MAG: hypothetical protein GIKADHBN_03378 [Phycisphaerales bacterium]|nr:hypothetical protein [Phycisphaerales bacterium]